MRNLNCANSSTKFRSCSDFWPSGYLMRRGERHKEGNLGKLRQTRPKATSLMFGRSAASKSFFQEWPRQTKPKKGQFMNSSRRHSGTEVQVVNRACFPKEKAHQNSHKNGRNSYGLFVLVLSLVWFAGATPDSESRNPLFSPPQKRAL